MDWREQASAASTKGVSISADFTQQNWICLLGLGLILAQRGRGQMRKQRARSVLSKVQSRAPKLAFLVKCN